MKSPLILASVLWLATGLAACGDDDGQANQNQNANQNNQNNGNGNGNGNANGNANGNGNGNGNGNTSLGVRDCVYTIRLTHDTATSVALAGGFNGWSATAWPLAKSGNQFEIRVTTNASSLVPDARPIDPGEHQYKLVVNGTEWWLDPANPLTRWDDAQANENSLLQAEDCLEPKLEVLGTTVTWAEGRVVMTLRVLDGAAARGLAAITATRDGTALVGTELQASLTTGAVAIDVAGLERGKYTFRVTATEHGGRSASLKLPVWVEPEYRNWEDLSVYAIMVDRFANGRTSNDASCGLEPLIDWQGGDWPGITQKLEDGFFDDLGVTALWISTPNDNPDTAQPGDCSRSFSAYHTYWPQASREVENHFGTADDLRDLVQAAHRRGIRVMVDWGANHVFIQHPLYQAHAGDPLWWNYPATTNPAELWRNKCGVLPDGWNAYALTCWFTEYMPDYNHRNHALVRELVDDAVWWVDTFDLDAYRVDATKHINSNYLRYLRRELDRRVASAHTPFYMVGENFIYDYNLIAQKISANELQGQFDFPLYGNVRWAFGGADLRLSDLNSFVYQSFVDYHAIADVDWGTEGYAPNHTLVGIFLGNHDVTRFSSMVAGQENGADSTCQVFNTGSPPQPTDETIYQRMELAFTFLFTVRGLPVVYYGDEFGLAGVHDPDNRRPMTFDLGSLSTAQQRLRARVARLGHLRQEHAALRTGRYDAFWGDPGCLVYAKAQGAEVAIVALAGPAGCSLSLPIKAGYGLIAGDVLSDVIPESGGASYTIASGMTIPLVVPAWGAQILVRE